MKRFHLLIVSLILLTVLNACGNSSPEKIKIDEFNQFCKEHPYPTSVQDYARDTIIDTALITQYAEKINELNELGVTAEQCPKLSYGEKIVSLSEYEKNIDFIKCFYSTKKLYDDADECFSNATKSLQAGKMDLGYSSVNEAASKYESAYDIVLQYDQESPQVSELAECLKMMYNGATNTATGLYTQSNFLVNVGLESLQKQALVYKVLTVHAQTVVQEVESICTEIAALQSD